MITRQRSRAGGGDRKERKEEKKQKEVKEEAKDSKDGKETKTPARPSRGSTGVTERMDQEASSTVTVLDEWRKENTKKMLTKADRATQFRAELRQLDMQAQGRSRKEIDNAIQKVLQDAGLNDGEYDAQKEKYARQALGGNCAVGSRR